MAEYKHSGYCSVIITFLMKSIGKDSAIPIENVKTKLMEYETTNSTSVSSTCDSVREFIVAHSEYFDLEGDLVSLKNLSHVWPSQEVEDEAISHLQRMLTKHGRIAVKGMSGYFSQTEALKPYLYKVKSEVNSKLVSLVQKNHENFTICDGFVTSNPSYKPNHNTTNDEAVCKEQHNEMKELRLMEGIVVYKTHNYGVIEANIKGRRSTVYFNKNSASLKQNDYIFDFFQVGSPVLFDAIPGKPGGSCDWKAAKVKICNVKPNKGSTDRKQKYK